MHVRRGDGLLATYVQGVVLVRDDAVGAWGDEVETVDGAKSVDNRWGRLGKRGGNRFCQQSFNM